MGNSDKQCSKSFSSLIPHWDHLCVFLELPPELLSIRLWQNPRSMISQWGGPGYSITRLGIHWEAPGSFLRPSRGSWPWGGLLRTDVNGGQSVCLTFLVSADVQVSLGDKGGETHTNSIKELCKCTDFPRPPKAMEEKLEHPSLGVGKPLVLTPDYQGRSPEQKENLRGFRSMGSGAGEGPLWQRDTETWTSRRNPQGAEPPK